MRKGRDRINRAVCFRFLRLVMNSWALGKQQPLVAQGELREAAWGQAAGRSRGERNGNSGAELGVQHGSHGRLMG